MAAMNPLLSPDRVHKGGIILPDDKFYNSLDFANLGVLLEDVEYFNRKHVNASAWKIKWHNTGLAELTQQGRNFAHRDDYTSRYLLKQLDYAWKALTAANQTGALELILMHSCEFDESCFYKQKALSPNVIVITDDQRMAYEKIQELRDNFIHVLSYDDFVKAILWRGLLRSCP